MPMQRLMSPSSLKGILGNFKQWEQICSLISVASDCTLILLRSTEGS